MKKLAIIVIALILKATHSFAQTGSIGGTVKNSKAEPMTGATVQLLHLPDSVQITAQMADGNGAYQFKSPKNGGYIIKVSLMGYASKFSSTINYKGTTITLPLITLTEQSKTLNAVTVTSTVPQLEQKSDRLVVNVEKMITTGDNALEVLKKAPGIKLDKDDNILYHNNGGVNVMIDGRMTYMSASEISNYLKTLPGNAISKIELMANPPANFDAAGTAGVINIIMKRNKLQGFKGTATANTGYGTYGKLSGGLNLNYNVGKLSIFTRNNGGYSNSYNKLNLGRQIGSELYNQENYWHPISNYVNYTAGADYFASKRSTLGIMFRGGASPQNADVTSNSVTLNSAGQQTGSVAMTKPQYTNAHTYALNLNYAFAIDSAGQKLSFDGDYIRSNSVSSEEFNNVYYNGAGTRIGDTIKLRNNTPAKYNIRSVKVDYVWPLPKPGALKPAGKAAG